MIRPLLQSLAAWLRGTACGQARPLRQDYSIAIPFPASMLRETPAQKTGVMVHIFHADMAPDFRRIVENVPPPCDIMVTTDTPAKKQEIEAVFADWAGGSVQVRLVPNRGRDIAPKLTAFIAEYAGYDLLLFLHSKKSQTANFGNQWFGQIAQSLCGSPAIVASILQLFLADRSLGMVIPQAYEPVRHYMGWAGNEIAGKELGARLGLQINLNGALDFPAGSMFWSRPAALAPLLEAGLTLDDFAEEAGQTGGTIAHAVERTFLLVCESAGYGWAKVADPKVHQNTETILPVSSFDELATARRASTFNVSSTMLQA